MENQPSQLRAVGYRRVSSKEQTDGHSLDAQEVHIRNYAQSQNWDVIHIYCDAGISAKRDSRRPALEQLLVDAEAGKFDVVIVDKVDRFYRHLGGLLKALDELNSHGVAFASVQEHLDFTSPWGKLMLTVLGMLAEIYIDTLRQETRKGKRQRAREGLWNGSIPFGSCKGLCSDCDDLNGKDYCPYFGGPNRGDGKVPIPHPVESQAVKLAFSLYASGEYSDGKLAEFLNTQDAVLPDGSHLPFRTKGSPNHMVPGPISKDYIRGMLNRIFYAGKIAYQGVDEHGNKRRRGDAQETYEGQHPALIDESLFDEVQEIRAVMATNPREMGGMNVRIFPLSGMIRCGMCGSPMRGVSNKGRRYYRDAAQIEKWHDCTQPLVRAEQVENQFVEYLRGVMANVHTEAALQGLQVAIDEVTARFDRVKFLFLAGEMSKDQFEHELERKETSLNSLRRSDLNAIMALDNLVRQSLVEWDRTLPTERKRLLRLIVEVVFLRGNTVVAFQPTLAFLPILRGEKGCSCGSDGHETSSYNFFYIPPKSTLKEALRMIKQFDETGDVDYESVTSLVQ